MGPKAPTVLYQGRADVERERKMDLRDVYGISHLIFQESKLFIMFQEGAGLLTRALDLSAFI